MCWFLIFSHHLIILDYTIHPEGRSWQHRLCGLIFGGFVVRLISLFTIYWMCIIWLKMDLFSSFFVKIFLTLHDTMAWSLLHLPVICWLEMSSMTCCTVFGYFLPMFKIHKLVQIFAGDFRFHGLLFFDWET